MRKDEKYCILHIIHQNQAWVIKKKCEYFFLLYNIVPFWGSSGILGILEEKSSKMLLKIITFLFSNN